MPRMSGAAPRGRPCSRPSAICGRGLDARTDPTPSAYATSTTTYKSLGGRHASCSGGVGRRGARLDTEVDNLRAALSWALESSQPGRALELAGALGEYWYARNAAPEGLQWLQAALRAAGPRASSALRASALLAEAVLTGHTADFQAVKKLAEESQRLYEALNDLAGVAACLDAMSSAEVMLGNLEQGGALAERALALARE